jgi:ABC-type sugar transport system permease subunit
MENTFAVEKQTTFAVRMRKNVGKYFWGYFFIFPSLLIIVLFKLIPLVVGFGISFSNWNLLSSP